MQTIGAVSEDIGNNFSLHLMDCIMVQVHGLQDIYRPDGNRILDVTEFPVLFPA